MSGSNHRGTASYPRYPPIGGLESAGKPEPSVPGPTHAPSLTMRVRERVVPASSRPPLPALRDLADCELLMGSGHARDRCVGDLGRQNVH